MLQNIRDKMQSQKWLTYLVLGALALVFAAWGAYGIVNEGFGGADYAAKVNGEKIPAAEVNSLWQQQLPQILQAYGGNLSDAQRAEFQQRLLDNAVRGLATNQYAHKVGFRISDEQLGQAFRSEPAFQIDGKFDLVAARSRLAAAGLTEAGYVNDLKRSLLINQMFSAIGVSDFLTPGESKRLLALLDEERELRYVMLQPDAYLTSEPVDAAAIDAWYKAHAAEFTLPESVKLAYAELALADVAATVAVTDDMVRERYEKDKASYISPETRRASHILITVDSETSDSKAAATAKDLYGRIKAGGDFAALAKQYSKDTVSAEKGGDLDWAARDIYEKEFADKLFAMQEGEVSEPVKTRFGYHIIRLDGVRPAAGRSLEDVRAELTVTMRNELAVTQFGTRQDQLQAKLERTGNTLDQLAKEFGMQRGEVADFQRGTGGLPLGSDADLNSAIFSEASIQQKRVGGPVQLGEDRITIFQVVDHHPAKLKPLDEVRASIVTALQRERATVAALAAGEAAAARLAKGESFEAVAASLKQKPEAARFISRSSPDLPVEIRDAVFAAARPVAGKPFVKAMKVDGGNVAVLAVTGARVQPMSDNPQLQQMRSQRELKRYSEREIDGYVAEIMKSAKVRTNPQAFQ
ncbi:MAG: SurA N-terminal domain-containing protein [Steroidobacteraceae bacterium]